MNLQVSAAATASDSTEHGLMCNPAAVCIHRDPSCPVTAAAPTGKHLHKPSAQVQSQVGHFAPMGPKFVDCSTAKLCASAVYSATMLSAQAD